MRSLWLLNIVWLDFTLLLLFFSSLLPLSAPLHLCALRRWVSKRDTQLQLQIKTAWSFHLIRAALSQLDQGSTYNTSLWDSLYQTFRSSASNCELCSGPRGLWSDIGNLRETVTETIKREGFHNAEATTESIRTKMVVDGSAHLWKVLQDSIIYFLYRKGKNSKKKMKRKNWGLIYSCDGKATFSASLLQSSVSKKPSEIILICWFAAQEMFYYFSQCWKQLCYLLFFLTCTLIIWTKVLGHPLLWKRKGTSTLWQQRSKHCKSFEVYEMTVPICTSHWCLVMNFWLKVCI